MRNLALLGHLVVGAVAVRKDLDSNGGHEENDEGSNKDHADERDQDHYGDRSCQGNT